MPEFAENFRNFAKSTEILRISPECSEFCTGSEPTEYSQHRTTCHVLHLLASNCYRCRALLFSPNAGPSLQEPRNAVGLDPREEHELPEEGERILLVRSLLPELCKGLGSARTWHDEPEVLRQEEVELELSVGLGVEDAFPLWLPGRTF